MILMIEDDDDVRKLAEFMLADAGFEVVSFDSGEPALSYLNRAPEGEVEAVILDLSLPVLDGLTIAEQIRLNEKAFDRAAVPVAFYTAHDQQGGGATERIMSKCSVEKIFHKPADTVELPHLVRDWLSSRKNDKQNKESKNAV